MQGRWRFRIVGKDCQGEYVVSGGKPVEHLGSDEAALLLAARFVEGQVSDISHIQAVSVGRPTGITDTPGRLLVLVLARYDRRGWIVQGDLMHGSWHRSLPDAVSYGAFRTVGHASETRIIDRTGEITHVVLIPSNGQRMTLY